MSSRDAIIPEIPRLRRYARALTGRSDMADDLVQDTLERGLEKWRFWQRERDLRPWLFSIMHNLHVDTQRRQGRIDYQADENLPEVLQRANQDDALELRDLDRALARMSVEQREVLLLVGLEELSYGEIAKVLNVPLGTVMSRLSRARSRLKSMLAGESVPQLKVITS